MKIGNTLTILVTFLFTKNLCTQFKKFALLTLFIFVEEVVKREVCRQRTL